MSDITIDELVEIVESYKWIRVKKFNPNPSGIDWVSNEDKYKESYESLEKHHKIETEFLIKKCRELAEELRIYKQYYD